MNDEMILPEDIELEAIPETIETHTTPSIFDREDGRQIESLVLQEMETEHLPTSQTACQVCPNAVWMQQSVNQSTQVKVYCRVLNTLIWSPEEPTEITHCDGLTIGVAEAEMEE